MSLVVDGIGVRSRMGYKFFGHPGNLEMYQRQNKFFRKFDKVSSTLLTVPKVLRQVKPAFIQKFFMDTHRQGLDKLLGLEDYFGLLGLFLWSLWLTRFSWFIGYLDRSSPLGVARGHVSVKRACAFWGTHVSRSRAIMTKVWIKLRDFKKGLENSCCESLLGYVASVAGNAWLYIVVVFHQTRSQKSRYNGLYYLFITEK